MSDKSKILKDKLKEVVAEQILEAAEAEMAELGLATVSMTAIAQRAGVAVGTLYNYFKDKDVLIATLLSDRQEKLYASLDGLQKNSELPFEKFLEETVDGVFQTFENQRNFLRIVLANEKPKEKQGNAPGNHFIERFRPLTDRGVAEGRLDAKDADLYPSVLAAIIRGVMIQRLHDTKRPFRESTGFVCRIFLNGARKPT